MNLVTPAPAQPQAAQDGASLVDAMGRRARAAARTLATIPGARKAEALRTMARAVRDATPNILEANARDMQAAAERKLSPALADRLALDKARVEAMAQGLDEIAALPDPVGAEMAAWERPNGLKIARVRVPIGVIGVIYEARPNVTADAGGLCLKAGNAAILRGGSESFHSSTAIAGALAAGLRAADLPEAAIQLVPTTDRAAVGAMLKAHDNIDVIVPRGGQSLIQRVMDESRVPVFAHLQGLCHIYIHSAADPAMARDIVHNAKLRRTGICGALETLLVDRSIAAHMLPQILADLRSAGCEIRGDEAVLGLDPSASPASAEDWATEYLDAILSVKIVDGPDEAIAHINGYGSHHTDSIVTEDDAAAARFLNEVDSAIVMHNASTQFADGGQFGMGAEIGIATGRLHARGPVGAEQLTTYKYVVRGSGQVRP